MGNSGSVEQTPTMKRSLHIFIAHSAALQRCIYGGASWKSMSLELIYICNKLDVSLTSIMYDVLSPMVSRSSYRSLKNLMNSLSVIYFMGLIKILFLSYLYNMNRYLFPLFEFTVNLIVMSVAICLLW